jgi:hypothetical protein
MRGGAKLVVDTSEDRSGLGGLAAERSIGRRRAVVAGLALLAVVGVIVVALTGGAPDGSGVRVSSGNARRSVIAALGTTDAAGSYDVAFTLHATSGTKPSPCEAIPVTPGAPATAPGVPRVYCTGTNSPVDVTGHGTFNDNPDALLVVTTVTGLGPITLYVNGTSLWELGGGDYGATPNAPGGAGPGAPLSGFANLVEGTLGPGPGALSVISLANPNGYLNLDQQAIQSATPAGNGSVDGTPVTDYDVTIDVAKLADAANLTDQQHLTIQDALQVLQAQGYTGTKATVGVDAAGFIRDITSTTRFADGSTLTRDTRFSNFGCAATVSLPNQPAPPTTTSVPCSSPDTLPSPPTSTSTSAQSTTTTSISSTTTTAPSPTTTRPG